MTGLVAEGRGYHHYNRGVAELRDTSVPLIPSDSPRWSVTAADNPIASVSPGEIFEVATLDCRAGTIRGPDDIGLVADASHINPVTGPIEVRGAESGGVLSIEILDIRGRDRPLMLVRPGVTSFDFVDRTALEFPEVADDLVTVAGIPIELRPMIGFIATTPASGEIPTGGCGRTGGNLDTPLIASGARVLLPVEVDGAGLFVGDAHLAQGDGELFLTGVETAATVRLAVKPLLGLAIPGPVVIAGGIVSVVGDGATLDQAASVASNRALRFLVDEFGFDEYDAGFVISAACHLRVCRYLPNYGSVCRIDIPQEVLDRAPAATETGELLRSGS